MKYYVVLDVEMCKVSKGAKCKVYHRPYEIIQLGAVLLNEIYEIAGEFNSFVKPRYGRLDSYITDLTGIHWTEIADAPTLAQVLDEFAAWIPDGEVEMVSWSDTDQYQIAGEMKLKTIHNEKIEDLLNHWIDSQKVFSEKVDSKRSYSLEEALISCDIETVGNAHDGFSDAYNTGLLFKKMMTQEKLIINTMYEAAKSKEIQHLTCTFGELLNGIDLATCIV